MNIEYIENQFTKYVKTFSDSNYDIDYKYKHSFRVMELSFNISKSLNLSEEEIKLATAIGLLHDVGRFKQLELYNGYSDQNIDHGDLGVEVLFDENLIDNFNIDKKYYDIIKFSIKNHNKLHIENTNDKIKLLQAKIIRDADKIDILRAYAIYGDYTLVGSDDPISPEVSKRFFAGKSILTKDIKSENDEIILKLSLIFDINFNETFDIFNKDKIVDFFRSTIKNKELFEPYFQYVENYIKERTEQNARKKI